jgi:thiol-disulfide isomerase/thioredoxin
MNQSRIVLIVLIIVLLIVGWYTVRVVQENRGPAESSDVVKSLGGEVSQSSYTTLDGAPVEVAEFFDEVIVVNSWASWSPQSKKQLTQLSELADEYQDQPVRFLAINRSEPRATAEAYLSTIEVSDNVNIVLDETDNFYEAVEAYAMPVTLIYSAKGDIVHQSNGSLSNQKLRSVVDEQLQL